MNDPMLGGTTKELDPGKAYTPSELSNLKDRGQQTGTQYPTQPQAQPAVPTAVRNTVSRRLCVVGYKGTADAWLATFKRLLEVNGMQVDRSFFLALDPREEDRQTELLDLGRQVFQFFYIIPYRYSIPVNAIGLPAPKNLHDLVGKATEEFRNAGPALICLPFNTLQPAPFDQIERHYFMSCNNPKKTFLGYTVRTGANTFPGAALVLPPNWSRHPDYPLAKGLSATGGMDLGYLKDEIIRSLAQSDVMVGAGMKVGPSTVIQTFPSDQVVREQARPPHQYPAHPVPAPVKIADTYVGHPVQPEHLAPVATVATEFSAEEKEAVLALISQLGMGALKAVDPARYGTTLAADAEFANQALNKAQGFRVRQGKKAKAQAK